jgi:hypothetical protein
MLNFGTIFRYKEKYYVYLVQTEELTFAARIHDIETTKDLVKSRDRKSKNPNNFTYEQPMYSFVVLTTDKFKDHCAHYGKPELSVPETQKENQFELIKELNKLDLENLKHEITEDKAVNPLLKETMLSLFHKKS